MSSLLEQRIAYRASIKRWGKLSEVVERSLRTSTALNPTLLHQIQNLSQTVDLPRSLDFIEAARETTEKAYGELLRSNARDSLSCFIEHISPDEPPAPHHDKFAELFEAMERRDVMRAAISSPPGHAKAICIRTTIPTPDGLKTIAALQVGDRVYSNSGHPATVTHKSPVFFDNDCFIVTTNDGASIKCDGDHIWTVRRVHGGKREFVDYTARQLFDMRHQVYKKTWTLPAYSAYVCTEKVFPIDPYVLGYWLGNGNRTSGAVAHRIDDGAFVRSLFNTRGCSPHETRGGKESYIEGFTARLKASGIYGNKHVPEEYFFGSIKQRQKLLQGLMDADGSVSAEGDCTFTNTSEELLTAVRRLLWSLGVRNGRGLQRAGGARRTTVHGAVKTLQCKDCYVIRFNYAESFMLPRKRSLARDSSKQFGRTITVEAAPSTPTQCIKIDTQDGLFLVGEGCLVTHNTKIFSRCGPAWYLGRNPNHRYIQGGHSQQFCENELGKYTRDIIEDPKFQEVFPNVRLSNASRAAGAWKIAAHRGAYLTRGAGQGISGYRGNMGGIDDPFGSKADADSSIIRAKVRNWLQTDFRTRLLPHSPMFIVATRWVPDDLIGYVEELTRNKQGIPWEIINYNAIIETEEEALADPLGRKIGEVLWPGYFDAAHILEFKQTLPTRDWLALYKGRPINEMGNIIQSAWFQRYAVAPFDSKDATGRVTNRVIKRVTLSIDCAQSASERADYTVIGAWVEDLLGRHYLIDVIRARVEYPAMCELIGQAIEKHKPHAVLIEDTGSGKSYIQQSQGKVGVPLIPIKTGGKDKEFRFDACAPTFQAGLVFLPEKASWLPDYEAELLEFPNGAKDDQVDMTSQYLNNSVKKIQYGSKRLHGMRNAA
jgi:predicted phage terminase large subunit-like protein